VKDWEGARDFAIRLSETELSASYGKPAVKLRGKAFLYRRREQGNFAVASPLGEKELLIETDPDTFCETDHYRRWPAVLGRYGSPEPER